MTAPVYKFDKFTLRPAELRDLPLATQWTLGDPEHRETTKPAFWIHQSESVNSFVLEDAKGAVFFFRIDAKRLACEIHIQFTKGNALTQVRTRRGIMEGFKWLEKMLCESGFEAYYFHSRSPQLIFFCQNRLGFEWDGTKLYRKIRREDDGQADRKETQLAARS